MSKLLSVALARRPETATEHLQIATRLLYNLFLFGAQDPHDRREVRAALHRLWLALREIERGRV